VGERGFRVQGLGEIAIHCADIDRMSRFYEEIIGLEPLAGGYRAGIRFYRIGEGVAGHTAVLALFQCEERASEALLAATAARTSSLHHIALALPREEQDNVVAWYEENGVDCRIEEFPWIGWRGIFVRDPEGNTVELVSYDASVKEGQSPA
jgi:catechol 2,3-dioxygenase-like lactoylglutathione lyase family enzyme